MSLLIDFSKDYDNALVQVNNIVQDGGVAVIPSETVYGLAASIFSQKGIDRIYQVKKRPADNPLICHIADFDQVEEIAIIPDKGLLESLMKAFWPGPLTFVLPKNKKGRKNYASARFHTVAVRMPNHPFFRDLIRFGKCPLAAPSANISGRPSGTHWEIINHELGDMVDAIVKDVPSQIGIESTVLDLSSSTPCILRPGYITFQELSRFLPTLKDQHLQESQEGELRSPGQKYQHYQPNCPVYLYHRESFQRVQNNFLSTSVGVITPDSSFNNKYTRIYKDSYDLSHYYYYWLYDLESQKVSQIVVVFDPKTEFDQSLFERISRSCHQD